MANNKALLEPAGTVDLQNTKWEWASLRKLGHRLEVLFFQKGLALFFVSILLGRALILSQLMPFALPFFAVVYMMRRKSAPLALFGLLAGSLTISISHMGLIFAEAALFLVSFRLLSTLHAISMKAIPYYVFCVVFAVKAGSLYLQNSGGFTNYDMLMAGIEGALSLVLVFIFIQSIPFLTSGKKTKTLKTEEMVSLMIMLASVMTGTIGWTLFGLSVDHILSRYLVILFAFTAGATFGSTVGVVTGLIFSLANLSSLYGMSLLAFAGLLGGLLREGRRIGTVIGLFVATLLVGVYGEAGGLEMTGVYESAAAAILLFLTPGVFIEKLARHIPGTTEYLYDQQQYARKVRDSTVRRVEQFSSVFEALSNSFSEPAKWKEMQDEGREVDIFLSHVTGKTCQTCFKKNQCWGEQFDATYSVMNEVMHEMDEESGRLPRNTMRDLEKSCNKAEDVRRAIHQEMAVYQANQKLKKQVHESRKLVAEQLQGVSAVMGDFAKEIQREQNNHHRQEEQLLDALQDFGVDIEDIEIYSMEPGSIDIDLLVPAWYGNGESEKLIAPLLSDILRETVIVQEKEPEGAGEEFRSVTLRSAKAFAVETGVAHAAKGGGFISGDSYSTIELGGGKYALAISDGMGNGERAHQESNETLTLLQKILQSGIEEEVAIKSINSVLALRTDDEIFSTLDLSVIDLQTIEAKFLKIGSTPSFIKRGNKVKKIESGNLPIGILAEVDFDIVTEQLRAGDLLVMMSDGVFEGPKHVENYDMWMKRKLKDIKTDDPQEVADILMEEVIRTRSGSIQDDMTVVTAKINHNIPKWAAIPIRTKAEKLSGVS